MRMAATAATGLLILGTAIVGASPASADTTVEIDCAAGTSTVEVPLSAGDVLTVTQSNCSSARLLADFEPGYVPAPPATLSGGGFCGSTVELIEAGDGYGCDPDAWTTSVQTMPDPMVYGPMIQWFSNVVFSGFVVTIAAVADSGPSPNPASRVLSHIQQVALPGSGECIDIDDSDLTWGTGLTGGWSDAWGEWLNEGTGGWVCSRTLSYSTSQSKWVVS